MTNHTNSGTLATKDEGASSVPTKGSNLTAGTVGDDTAKAELRYVARTTARAEGEVAYRREQRATALLRALDAGVTLHEAADALGLNYHTVQKMAHKARGGQ